VTAQKNDNSNTDVEDQVTTLLSQMTLRDKIGQMIMDAENTLETPINIGAYLVGAADPPLPLETGNTPSNWRARLNTLNDISKHPTLNIPVLFGTDAVHGHNVISGGTIFPHNIGL
jgi:beta-glucosidase